MATVQHKNQLFLHCSLKQVLFVTWKAPKNEFFHPENKNRRSREQLSYTATWVLGSLGFFTLENSHFSVWAWKMGEIAAIYRVKP